MVNRPIVTHFRTPNTAFALAATALRVLALSQPSLLVRVQLASDLGHDRRRRGGDRRDGLPLSPTSRCQAKTTETILFACFDDGRLGARATHPMDWEAGAVAGGREVGGGERWRSVGDEDRHAAFFLTIADEKNKPEFCKSDPRRRRGWG